MISFNQGFLFAIGIPLSNVNLIRILIGKNIKKQLGNAFDLFTYVNRFGIINIERTKGGGTNWQS
ncbi:hypothetical protein COA25_08435 [Bacillus cereus]|nr:hypothetical protein COA25_08435 [Bacillus cereus]